MLLDDLRRKFFEGSFASYWYTLQHNDDVQPSAFQLLHQFGARTGNGTFGTCVALVKASAHISGLTLSSRRIVLERYAHATGRSTSFALVSPSVRNLYAPSTFRRRVRALFDLETASRFIPPSLYASMSRPSPALRTSPVENNGLSGFPGSMRRAHASTPPEPMIMRTRGPSAGFSTTGSTGSGVKGICGSSAGNEGNAADMVPAARPQRKVLLKVNNSS